MVYFEVFFEKYFGKLLIGFLYFELVLIGFEFLVLEKRLISGNNLENFDKKIKQ